MYLVISFPLAFHTSHCKVLLIPLIIFETPPSSLIMGIQLLKHFKIGFSSLHHNMEMRLVRLLIKLFQQCSDLHLDVNIDTQLKSKSLKWKILRGTAKLMYRAGAHAGHLMERLALGCGVTALHYAVRRGDAEVVQILLDAHADPYLKNDLGMNAFDYCDQFGPFPNVKRALEGASVEGKSVSDGDDDDDDDDDDKSELVVSISSS